MEHAAYDVDILNGAGEVIGKKQRQAIDKLVDIYHTVFVLVMTPVGELVLGVIPERSDLKNLYPHLIGSPVATIRRHGETAKVAASRGLSRELLISKAHLKLLGEVMLQLPSNRQTFASVFYIQADMPKAFSSTDIESLLTLATQEFEALIKTKPQTIAPTLQEIWRLFRHKLPS